MKLSKICKDIDYRPIKGSPDTEVTDIIYDSRKVAPGTMFVCMVGAVTDGHKYIPDAVAKGVSVLVIQNEDSYREFSKGVDMDGVTVIQVDSTRLALAYMSAAFFDYPAKKLTTVGLTGTKGKTTTTFIIQDVLTHAGVKAGLIGTIATVIGNESTPAKNTTPENLREAGSASLPITRGVIEALRHGTLPVFSVQWHPERMCLERAREDAVDGSVVLRHFLSMCAEHGKRCR